MNIKQITGVYWLHSPRFMGSDWIWKAMHAPHICFNLQNIQNNCQNSEPVKLLRQEGENILLRLQYAYICIRKERTSYWGDSMHTYASGRARSRVCLGKQLDQGRQHTHAGFPWLKVNLREIQWSKQTTGTGAPAPTNTHTHTHTHIHQVMCFFLPAAGISGTHCALVFQVECTRMSRVNSAVMMTGPLHYLPSS